MQIQYNYFTQQLLSLLNTRGTENEAQNLLFTNEFCSLFNALKLRLQCPLQSPDVYFIFIYSQ